MSTLLCCVSELFSIIVLFNIIEYMQPIYCYWGFYVNETIDKMFLIIIKPVGNIGG